MEEIDLKEMFNIFWTKKLQMILIILGFIVAGIIYTSEFTIPMYSASTTLVLASSEDTEKNVNTTITATDITINSKLVSTYSELIRSKTILDDVINQLQLDKTVGTLKSHITVSAVKDTDLIQIRVTDKDPEIAKMIASEVANVFIDKVANGVYHINNVQVWDKAEVQNTPYNINHGKDVIIFAFIGIVVSSIYALVANMLDTTVKSKEDIEKRLGLSVLTTIPLCDFDYILKASKGGRRY